MRVSTKKSLERKKQKLKDIEIGDLKLRIEQKMEENIIQINPNMEKQIIQINQILEKAVQNYNRTKSKWMENLELNY